MAFGYTLPEALRASDNELFFSDAAAGGVYRLGGGGIETVIPKRRGVGGLLLHRDGGVVVTGRDLIHVRDGETRLLFSAEGALGLNDMTTDAAGSILVGALRMDWRDPVAGQPAEVWRVTGVGHAEIVAAEIRYPNGMALSPRGDTLYVADFVGACVHAFTLEEGRVSARTVLVRLDGGTPDGLAVDAEGGIWVATGRLGSLDRYSPEGELTERLRPPAKFVVTACFGGTDGRDLYLATADSTDHPELGGSIFVTRTPVAGNVVPVATI